MQALHVLSAAQHPVRTFYRVFVALFCTFLEKAQVSHELSGTEADVLL